MAKAYTLELAYPRPYEYERRDADTLRKKYNIEKQKPITNGTQRGERK